MWSTKTTVFLLVMMCELHSQNIHLKLASSVEPLYFIHGNIPHNSLTEVGNHPHAVSANEKIHPET